MGMIIGFILWLVLASLVVFEYRTEIQNILDNSKKIIVLVIFLIGGPFFAIVNILTYVLDIFMPEGWNDDDDIERY